MALDPVTLTAELNDDGRWVVFSCTCIGATSATLYRVTPSGPQAVRGFFEKSVFGAFNAADYEAPQQSTLTYFARVTDGVSTKDSPLVTVDGMVNRGGDVIFSLTNPLAYQQIVVVTAPSLRSPVKRDVVEVIGRPDPVVVSDVRRYASGTMTIATLSDSERTGLNNLLSSGGLIAFSPHKPEYGFEDIWYLSIGDVTERRVTPLGYRPERYWDLEIQRVAPPPATFVGPAFVTWQDVYSAGTTWGEWKAAGTTWIKAQVA